MSDGVVVRAPARLHFGMLDPAGLGARRFGGFGVGITSPAAEVAVISGPGPVCARGEQADRAAGFARRACDAYRLRADVQVEVRRAIPAHSGLGSGTKLGLAIARGLAELAGAPTDAPGLARAAGRGARSSVGAWTFVGSGLVVEAGVDETRDGISPLLARIAMPASWRCVLVRPHAPAGLSGAAEERFFAGARSRDGAEPSVSRLLLTELLPGLQAGDLAEFGAALTAIQRVIGEFFADAQGGVFHRAAAPFVEALLALGVAAVGQSSWGPTVYGIVADAERAAHVAGALGDRMGTLGAAEITVVDFDRTGATVEPIEVAT